MHFRYMPFLARTILTCCILLFVMPAVAQDRNPVLADGMKNRKFIASANLIADVELLKPVTQSYGLELNTHLRILSKPRIRKGGNEYNPKFAERELFVKPAFGFIYRRRYHTGIYFTPGIAYRHTSPLGIYMEMGIDAGYYFAKLNAPVYEMQPDGTFEEVGGGFSNVMLGGKVMAGFDLSKKYEIPICLNGGAGVFYRFPNNQQWIRHIFVQVGFSYIFRRVKE